MKEYVMAVSQGILLILLIGYLFYDTWLSVPILLPIFGIYIRTWYEERCRIKEQEFREQFRVSIQAMAAALNVGYSVENAIREAAKDIKPIFKRSSRIQKEFQRMIHQMEVNRPVEQVMLDFSERIEQEDVNNFVTVFTAAKRTGGDSIAILRTAVQDISDKLEVEKEIQTLLAAKQMEFKIMCVVPFGILLYMRLSFPGFMEVLYKNLLGCVLMTVCLCVYVAAYRIGRKMVDIEV